MARVLVLNCVVAKRLVGETVALLRCRIAVDDRVAQKDARDEAQVPRMSALLGGGDDFG